MNKENKKIFIVEDEPSIANLMAMSLKKEGYAIVIAKDGLLAYDILEKEEFSLILLDVMLPGMDGFDLMEGIREKNVPIIFVTAKSELRDRIKGLKRGADDYISKPFEIAELLARVEAVLRRIQGEADRISVHGLDIDVQARIVMCGVKELPLTKKEFDTLLLFVQNTGVALSRERIYERVWKDEYMGDSRTVDLHVQRLRKKLGWEEKIATVYKVGYRLGK